MSITRKQLAQVAPANPAQRTKYVTLDSLPQSLQNKRKAFVQALDAINSDSVARPSGGPSWNRLAAKHKFTYTVEALFKVTGSRNALLTIENRPVNLDMVFAAICAKANAGSDAKLLEAYCSILEDAARVLRKNIPACAKTRKQESDYRLFQASRDEARNALNNYDDYLAQMSDSAIASIKNHEEIAELKNQVAALTKKVHKH